MHVTAMHLAFLTSKSVTKDTKLGRMVIDVAMRHNTRIVRQQTERDMYRQQKAQEKAHSGRHDRPVLLPASDTAALDL